MKNIVLIACAAKKGKVKVQAKDLYQSALFKNSLAYAKKLNLDKIYILSALYGVVNLEDEIEPYNVTLCQVGEKIKNKKPDLTSLTKEEVKSWGSKVISQLEFLGNDIENDNFIMLAGLPYINPLRNSLKNIEEPLKDLRLGERIKFLKENV